VVATSAPPSPISPRRDSWGVVLDFYLNIYQMLVLLALFVDLGFDYPVMAFMTFGHALFFILAGFCHGF